MAQITVARIEAIEKCQQEHDEWINGNGKPGAKVQLSNLELRLDTIEKKLDQINGALTGLVITGIGAVIVYILLNVIPHVAK